MTDRDFFYKKLGLSEPWQVKDVRLDLCSRRVEMEIGVKAGTAWGQDGLMLPIDGYQERTWRHLDTMQLEAVLRARVPRVRYPDGRTEMVSLPSETPRSRWTVAFEALAIRVMQACGSINEASKLLRIDWRAAQRIMERAVQRGLERVETLGIDEKSFRKGHRYGTLLADLDEGRVLEVVEERTTQAAGAALKGHFDSSRWQGGFHG
jgi:transposase